MRHMKKKMADGATEVDVKNFSVYPKYVANMMLDHEMAPSVLKSFAAAFGELRSCCSILFPVQGLADAFVAMSSFDPKKGDELQIDFLSVAARTRLVQSKCYAAFVQGVFEQKLGDVKSDVEAPDAERKEKVDALLASREDHAELLFAATVLEQKLGQYDMVKYLFSSQNHFPWLQARSAEAFPPCCAEIDCR